MIQQTQPSKTQQAKMFLSIGKSLAASYIGWTILITFLVGLIVGWFVLGWGIAPVTFTDAQPVRLSAKAETPYRQAFLRFAADSYVSNGMSIDDIAQRLGGGWTWKEVLDELDKMSAPGQPGADRVAALKDALVKRGGEIGPKPKEAAGGTTSPLVVLLIIVVLAAAILVGIFLVRRIRTEQPQSVPAASGGEGQVAEGAAVETPIAVSVPAVSRAAGGARPVEKTEWAGEQQPPLAQYVTTYALGDDRYDMSFSIETGSGDFLGECGVGISKTIGVGSPDKVTALEVWLFDKNDIRTVTKVLMSEHCFNDAALKAELAPKGEAILAKKGEVVTLTTQTLKVNARVDDLMYGTGGLPPSSFFQQATIELAAWQTGS